MTKKGKVIMEVCCLCGGKYKGMGNNPYPVARTKGMLCCDDCNKYVVIPMRFKQYMLAKRNKGVA